MGNWVSLTIPKCVIDVRGRRSEWVDQWKTLEGQQGLDKPPVVAKLCRTASRMSSLGASNTERKQPLQLLPTREVQKSLYTHHFAKVESVYSQQSEETGSIPGIQVLRRFLLTDLLNKCLLFSFQQHQVYVVEKKV